MSNDITPFDFSQYKIRWITKDGEQWAVLNDFCEYLGISKRRAREYGLELSAKGDGAQTAISDTQGKLQKTYIINKLGMAYILKTSNKEIPKQFQEWLGTEVFESIVTDGGYIAPWVTVEQLARVQEKLDYTKLRAMLARSIDYNPNDEDTRYFFKDMQNMFFQAVTGMVARQIRASRDIVNWEGKRGPTKRDLEVAKNYLTQDELELCGLYVTNAITQCMLRFHKKEYTMFQFKTAIRKSLILT